MWKVVTSSNLNPPLKLFFYSPILANNNLLLKIYCENILVAFLIFYIIFPFLISSIRFFFSLGFFSTIVTTHVSHSYLYLPFFFFFQFIPDHFFSYISFSFFIQLSLFLLFPFLLDSRTLSPSISHKQILSHTHIDHRQRSGDWRSTQIGVLHFFFFFLV